MLSINNKRADIYICNSNVNRLGMGIVAVHTYTAMRKKWARVSKLEWQRLA